MTAMTGGSWAYGQGPGTPRGLSPPGELAADDVAALAAVLFRLAEDVEYEKAALGAAGALEWESVAAELFRRALAERCGMLATVAAELRDAAWQLGAYGNHLYAGLDCRLG